MLKLLQKGIWQYLEKLHIYLLFNQIIIFLEIYPKDTVEAY